MSNTISQDDFIGGMTALFDSTKTPNNSYRVGLNCRARKNAIHGAFRPIKVTTPAGKHQALFAVDKYLIVVIGGVAYRYLPSDNNVTPVVGFTPLSATTQYLYHVSIPVPTNVFVGSGDFRTYNDSLSQLVSLAIVQDGVNQPVGILANLTSRSLGTFNSWTYNNPEYVPIGTYMAFSGKKLYITAPDGRKIFHSKTGRGIDFVLDFDPDTGEKRGDAYATALSLSSYPLTAIVPSQTGGILGFTRVSTHSAELDFNAPLIFDEPYIRTADLFPVGAVSHLGFTSASGESVFVSPGGIQSFNEVAQQLAESNNTPFGAPINDYLIRPISRVATIRADNYTFFGLDTVFGSGIAVFDNQLGAFVSFDLVGAVKEFALLDDYEGNLNRLFFITYTNEMYEMPLYNGEKSPYHIYFGEYSATPNERYKPRRVVAAFNNIRSSGVVDVSFFVDRLVRDIQTRELTIDNAIIPSNRTIPVSFPTEGETENQVKAFTNEDTAYGQSVGIQVSCPADSNLTAIALELEGQKEIDVVEEQINSIDYFTVLGDIYPDAAVDTQQAEVIEGRPYYFYTPAGAGAMLNGDENISTTAAHGCKRFVARADTMYGDTGTSIVDFTSFESLLIDAGHRSIPLLLGGLGHTDRIAPIQTSLNSLGIDYHALLGPHEFESDARTLYTLGYLGTTRFAIHETPRVRFFLLSFPLSAAASTVDTNGNLVAIPPEMEEIGEWNARIEATIAAGEEKFNVVLASHSPYTTGAQSPGVAAFRWNFKRLGVSLVISAYTEKYERTYLDGVNYVTAGTGNPTSSDFGVLRLTATQSALSGVFVNADQKIRDQFFVPI